MLRKRILTAIVLLGILVPVMFVAPRWCWGAVTLLILAIAFSEWSALLPGERPGAIAWAIALSFGLGLLLADTGEGVPNNVSLPVYLAALLFWLLIAPGRLLRHRCHGGGRPLALLLLVACWIALIDLRAHGAWALVSAMAIVWIADIAAYFSGRAFGRHKLAPAISPGKTWEGVAGGAIAVAALGWWAAQAPGLQSGVPYLLFKELGALWAVVALVGLAGLSVVGDLHESLLKRVAGVKDSGSLLPGHGGFLDRIDALVPTMPAMALIHELLR